MAALLINLLLLSFLHEKELRVHQECWYKYAKLDSVIFQKTALLSQTDLLAG